MKSKFTHFYLFSARFGGFSSDSHTFSGFSGFSFRSAYIPDTKVSKLYCGKMHIFILFIPETILSEKTQLPSSNQIYILVT